MAKNLKKRFLFTIAGGYGHFHPLVPLARALKRAGHEVAFAAGTSLRPLVEAAGFAVLPVGGNLASDPEYQQFQAERRGLPPGLDAELFIYSRLWCGIAPRLRTPQLVAMAREWQPDVLIRETGEYAAVIAAEHIGLPHVAVSVMASLRAQLLFEMGAAAQLDPIRRSWNLPPDPALASLYRYLHLVYSPPTFSMQAVDAGLGEAGVANMVPPTTHFIRPQFFDQADTESLPDWLAQLPANGQPTVYVTMGTEVNREPGMYPLVLQTIIEGLRDLPVNLIVTLGRDKDPADFGAQPPNVYIERYIPQSLLLPRCDLIVMHGGSNSLLAAVDVGLPMVAIPLIADQFFNAAIVQRLQLGQSVQPGSPWQPDLRQLTPSSIRAAVEEVLNYPINRRKVAQLQAEMHALPNQQFAVDLVERVAAEREPVLNAGC